MKMRFSSVILIVSALALGCQAGNKQSASVSEDSGNFDAVIDDKEVKLYTIENGNIEVTLTNYGARLVSLLVPDDRGQLVDVILGYDTAEEFKANASNFYGAIVGRYGNRIGGASFTLNGETYTLEKNNGNNTLHGGNNGVFNKVWDVKNSTDTSVTLTYTSPDLEAGFPGTVVMDVTYAINKMSGLEILYRANTDKETVLNLTNHAYFNLNGEGSDTILDHELQIDADRITEVDDELIPTGNSLPVEGTPFDFRQPFVLIGERIDEDHPQLKIGKGYDHNFELFKEEGFDQVALVYAPKTGIEMQVLTTEPGLQFYSGNFMSKKDPTGKGGKAYPFRSAFCLETQHYPDSPNHSSFPSTVLKPGEEYTTKTEYRFSIR